MSFEKSPDIRRGGERVERANPGWEDSDEYFSDIRYEYLKRVIDEQGIPLDANSKVLEIGSGNGHLSELMKKDGIEVVSIDARPRGPKDALQVNARIEQLPFADDTFDLIISSRVFDDMVYDQDQNTMMKEIHRVLKAEGKYIGLSENIFEVPAGLKLVSDVTKTSMGVVFKKENL